MAKPPDNNDRTMEVSASQLVPDKPKPPPKRPVGPQNDMSMWAGAVVGGDQFMPAPAPAKQGRGKGWLLGGVAVLVLAGGGYAAYRYGFASGTPAGGRAPATPAPGVDAVGLIQVDAPIDAPADAAIDAAVDAAVDAGIPDAAPEPTIAPTLKPKPAAKKKVVKKKPVKKRVVKKKPRR